MPRGRKENLVQYRDFSPEQRREWSAKAGKASAEKKRRNRLLNDVIHDLMLGKSDDAEAVKKLEEMGFQNSYEYTTMLAVIRKAEQGDVEANRFLRDTRGEKPTDSMKLGVFNTPVKALDLETLSDQELQALADRADDEE